MKTWIFLASSLLSNFCFSAEFDNAIGLGAQYGGLVGWQGSVSESNIHGRMAIGLLGATLGIDVGINEYFSVGGTVGVVALSSLEALNISYHSSGKYTEGWRFCVDAGNAENEFFERDPGRFVAISVGYSFK